MKLGFILLKILLNSIKFVIQNISLQGGLSLLSLLRRGDFFFSTHEKSEVLETEPQSNDLNQGIY